MLSFQIIATAIAVLIAIVSFFIVSKSRLKGSSTKSSRKTVNRRMAKQEDVKAQDKLPGNLFSGQGVEKNYFEAMEWCRKAADQGHELAINALKRLNLFP